MAKRLLVVIGIIVGAVFVPYLIGQLFCLIPHKSAINTMTCWCMGLFLPIIAFLLTFALSEVALIVVGIFSWAVLQIAVQFTSLWKWIKYGNINLK